MKHVRALPAQPPLLQQYCTNHPNEPLRPANEARFTWDTFKADGPAYIELLRWLTQAQQGICIYCEQRLVDADGELVAMDYQVEHVLPKSGAVGRVLDWKNLALACCGGTYPYHSDVTRRYASTMNTSCGQEKDASDLSCDPRNLPLLDPLVKVGINGKLGVDAGNCAAAGVSVIDVDDAVRLLNLDCERLRKARQDIGDQVRSWFVFMLEEIASPRLSHVQKQTAVDLLVATRLQPDAEGNLLRFWSAERSAIGEPAEKWLGAHQALFV